MCVMAEFSKMFKVDMLDMKLEKLVMYLQKKKLLK